jgi:hypothetical protein
MSDTVSGAAQATLAGLLLASGVALAAGGCASLTAAGSRLGTPADKTAIDEDDFHCARAIIDWGSPYRLPLAGAETDPALAAHLEVLPYRARRAALAAGLEPLLARLLAGRDDAHGAPTLEGLTLEQDLTLRIMAFHSQMVAATFEAGCTADMIQKVLPEITHEEQTRQLRIAIGSLVLAAAGSMAAGASTLHNSSSMAPAIIDIVAGGGIAGLSIAALTRTEHSIRVAHSRNRLLPLWRGSDPDHLYPSFVFRMLMLPDAAGGTSPRDRLMAGWKADIEKRPAAEQAAARELLLGDGGVYDETLLILRAEMFELLQSTIQGLARDLELLNRSLVRSLTNESPSPPSFPPEVVPTR